MSENRGKFLIAGKYMGPILGQNLVNVWVTFHFPSGTSLPTNNLMHGTLLVSVKCTQSINSPKEVEKDGAIIMHLYQRCFL